MPPLNEVLALAVKALREPDRRPMLVSQLVEAIDETPKAERVGAAWPILRDLRLDLAYYVADPVSRAEERVYYGDDRLVFELRRALKEIRNVIETSEGEIEEV